MHVEAIVRGRPRLGEDRSGDAAIIVPTSAATWVTLFDAVGHGDRAADVVGRAIAQTREILRAEPEAKVEDALAHLDLGLRGTAGACAAMIRFDEHGASVGGVGNVAVHGLDTPVAYKPSGGVLGGRMRPPRSSETALSPRARILMHTDGIQRRAPLATLAELDDEALCDALVRRHAHAHDDATLILVTYLG